LKRVNNDGPAVPFADDPLTDDPLTDDPFADDPFADVPFADDPFADDDIAEIRSALLAFYDASARPLPWRSTADPYAIWISEVMAQQTRVDTVVPYYERWLRRFPDVAALADAPLDAVYKEWEGLGYYSRARNLHAAARTVHERHGGHVPSSYEELRALPGIGDYTAGAISSIAFNERQPAVDGNVRRVLSRLLDDPNPAAVRLRSVAAALVPADRPGDFNQAVMELGATICTPSSPACGLCPLSHLCAARAAGTQHDRPLRAPKPAVPTFDVATVVIRGPDDRVLLQRRPASGLLAGMWSFPASEVPHAGEAPQRALAIARTLCDVAADPPVELGRVEHTFSHRRERYHCHVVAAVSGAVADADVAWIGHDRSHYALPRAQQRIHDLACRLIGLSGRGSAPA
jgi:A/G-specific adenine glycosylase